MKYSALIGCPVEHSISPQLFDLLSKMIRIEYSHLKIRVNNKEDLKSTIDAMCKLDFVGFNITCPYKLDIMNLIDECDSEAKKIYSINSVIIKNNKTKGYNTDGKAAMMSIKQFYDINSNDKVVIIGAGGAAYPILYEILKITNHVVVFNRSFNRAKKMCETIDKNVKYYDLNDKKQYLLELKNATVIINTSSVGMYPNNNETLVDEKMFKKIINKEKKCFFDVIFNPWDTKFIELAKKYNQIAVSGGYMLIYQAILFMQLCLERKIEISNEEIEIIVNKMIKVLEGAYD